MDPAAYIAQCVPYALAEQSTYGVPASVALAQGALESGWGGSAANLLPTVGHNHHGIKALDTPGRIDNPHRLDAVMWKTSPEFYDGWTTQDSPFLTFPNDAAGYLGHGFFLRHRGSGLYDAAFEAGDSREFARRMGAKYATDPSYVSKLLDIIDRHDLTQYDQPQGAPMRIVIMPSSQEHNACRMGDTEQAHTRLIAKRAAELVREAGHDARYVVAGNDALSDSEQLAQMAAASNALDPDLHVDVHTDAGGATGPSVFYYGLDGQTTRSEKLGRAIYAELVRAVPFSPNGVRARNTLYMLRKTTASSVLVECWPHDKTEQARWGHANVEKVAQAIAAGVLKVAGGTIPQPKPEPPVPPVSEEFITMASHDVVRNTDQQVIGKGSSRLIMTGRYQTLSGWVPKGRVRDMVGQTRINAVGDGWLEVVKLDGEGRTVGIGPVATAQIVSGATTSVSWQTAISGDESVQVRVVAAVDGNVVVSAVESNIMSNER